MNTSLASPRTRTNHRRSPDSSSRSTAATTGFSVRCTSSQASMRSARAASSVSVDGRWVMARTLPARPVAPASQSAQVTSERAVRSA